MKLVHKNFDRQINFDENLFQTLIIENPQEFYSLTKQLISQIDGEYGEWVLSENGKILQIENIVSVIYDFFSLALSNKKIENGINAKVLNVFKEGDYFQEVQEIASEIHSLGEKISDNIDLPLESSEEITYQTICKLLSFKILEEEKLVDKIATWVDVNIKLKNTKIFVFVNLQSVLDADKMATLLKQLKYWQVGVLNIASSDYAGSEIFEKIIIDKDLCVI
ncbi:MAG: type II-A CRISPR-associated protein Csn2 [Clostridia bacterium]|nr:type II-A CRISPR-associated protein Csn2 [Clostridia bacterium]